jgi:hypothetical protein
MESLSRLQIFIVKTALSPCAQYSYNARVGRRFGRASNGLVKGQGVIVAANPVFSLKIDREITV